MSFFLWLILRFLKGHVLQILSICFLVGSQLEGEWNKHLIWFFARIHPASNKLEIHPKPWYTHDPPRWSLPSCSSCFLWPLLFFSFYFIYERSLIRTMYYICQQLLSLIKTPPKWNVLNIFSNKTCQINQDVCFRTFSMFITNSGHFYN